MSHMPDAGQYRRQRARGHGAIATKLREGRTRLDRFYQEGCAKIRMPDTFSADMEAVLINSSGGLTGGDRIRWDVEAGEGTTLAVTTQACEKIYRSSGGTADVAVNIVANAGSTLHWLPQESIFFDRASLTRRLEVDLHETAEFLAIEAVLLGRKAMGEVVEHGFLRDRWRIRRGGHPVHAEDLLLDGGIHELVAQRAVLGGLKAFATLLYVGPMAEALLPRVRQCLGEAGGASQWNGKLVVRLSASDGFAMRKILVPVISALRNDAAVPKVWNL